MQPITVLIWTCIVVFIATSVITLLALVGIIKLGGNTSRSDFYLKQLFKVLLIEIVIVGVAAFASNINVKEKYIKDLQDQIGEETNNVEDSVKHSKDTILYLPGSDTQNIDQNAKNPSNQKVNTTEQKKSYNSKKNIINKTKDKIDIAPPANFEKKIVRETFEVSVLATTDKPTEETKTIAIPDGSKYLEYTTVEHSKNGDANYKVDLIKNNDEVIQVKIKVWVGPQKLFGPRNWIRMTLQVIVESQK